MTLTTVNKPFKEKHTFKHSLVTEFTLMLAMVIIKQNN